MSKGIVETVSGAYLTAVGIGLMFASAGPLGKQVGELLIQADSGLILAGVGTMLSKGPMQGFATTVRDPVAPWNIAYGCSRVAGTLAYLPQSGERGDE